MAKVRKVEWEIDHHFDPKTTRHYNNGTVTVLHCHHFITLYSQLADDAEMVDGKGLLCKAAELSFYEVLKSYFEKHGVTKLMERVALVEEYWKICGMGLLHFENVGEVSASAEMAHSHVDEGWIKKWGTRDKPVNFVGQGYLMAAMAAMYDLPMGSYKVNEVQSIVSGAETSKFAIVRA